MSVSVAGESVTLEDFKISYLFNGIGQVLLFSLLGVLSLIPYELFLMSLGELVL